jgi:hypothetical protein
LIATIDNINSYGKYKALLSEMEGISDSFDLKIINSDVDLDYITDPVDITALRQGLVGYWPY